MNEEQRVEFKARMEERKALHEQLKTMSPEQRSAFKKKHHAEKMKNMSADEKKRFKHLMKQHKNMFKNDE